MPLISESAIWFRGIQMLHYLFYIDNIYRPTIKNRTVIEYIPCLYYSLCKKKRNTFNTFPPQNFEQIFSVQKPRLTSLASLISWPRKNEVIPNNICQYSFNMNFDIHNSLKHLKLFKIYHFDICILNKKKKQRILYVYILLFFYL